MAVAQHAGATHPVRHLARSVNLSSLVMLPSGAPLEILRQKDQITSIATKHGGVSGGAEGGRTGYNVTMAIAYIGDFLLQRGVRLASLRASCLVRTALPPPPRASFHLL